MGVSIRPSEAVEGGVFEDGDYRFTESAYVNFEYGQGGVQTFAFKSVLVSVTDPNATYQQVWSIGRPDTFQPSEDGQEIVAVGKRSGLSAQCNFIELTRSAVDGGYPEDRMSDKAGEAFDGLEAYVAWHPAKERQGLENERADGRKRMIALIDKVNKLPWESGAVKAGGKVGPGRPATGARASAPGSRPGSTPPVPATSTPAPTEDEDAILTELATLITSKMDGAESITLAALRTAAFRDLASHPLKAQITRMAANRDKVVAAAEMAGYAVEGDTVVTVP